MPRPCTGGEAVYRYNVYKRDLMFGRILRHVGQPSGVDAACLVTKADVVTSLSPTP